MEDFYHMNDSSHLPEDPNWLDEFEDLANQQLDYGSSCEQVHPIVERWFQKLMENDPPESRRRTQPGRPASSCPAGTGPQARVR